MPTVNATDACVVQAADLAGYAAQVRPADACVLALTDAASKAIGLLPDLFSENMGTDYTRLQPDPSSYRILEKKTW
jgi:hypothetical protein